MSNPPSDARNKALLKIASIHWKLHEKSKPYEPTALDAAVFVESVKRCPHCKPKLDALPE